MSITHTPSGTIAVDGKEATPLYDFQNNKFCTIVFEGATSVAATGNPVVDIYYVYKYGTGASDITDGSASVTPPAGHWIGSISLRTGLTTIQRSATGTLTLPISGLASGTAYCGFVFINKSGQIISSGSKFVITSSS